MSTLILVKPDQTGKLSSYLVVLESIVRTLFTKEDKGTYNPIHYISKVILDSEIRYRILEKLSLALVTAVGKLHPYFEAYNLIVLTSYLIRALLHMLEASRRMMKYALKNRNYDIKYQSLTIINLNPSIFHP